MAKETILINATSLNSILDISRLESGFVQVNLTNIDLELLVEEVTSQFRWSAREQDVEIRTRPRRCFPVIVRSDRDLLGRILSNLVSNGIKYRNPKKGAPASILVAVTGPATRPRIDVVDNGIGIAKAHWEDIFKPFFQLDNPERNREKGQGLGLSIVNAIVPLLAKHSIEMRSVMGKGTRFFIYVPRSDETIALALGRAEVSSLGDFAGIFILCVEDDELVRRSTAALFDAHGLLYKLIKSVEELRHQIEKLERMPDVILTDYRLPAGFNGGDVIRKVREEFDSPIPAIIITGEASDLSVEPWADSTTRILRKPVPPQTMLWEISKLITYQDRDLDSEQQLHAVRFPRAAPSDAQP
jgi:two-component system, sensor histidine kinase